MNSILGIIIAASIGLLVLKPLITQKELANQRQTEALVAGSFKTFINAAQQYVRKNYTTLETSLPVGLNVREVSPQTLVNDHDLRSGVSPYNAYGQLWRVYIQQPVQGDVEAYVVSNGGRRIMEPEQLIQVAAMTGPEGGYVPYNGMLGKFSSSIAQGANGIWTLPVNQGPNPGPGQFLGRATLISGSLDPSDSRNAPDNLYRDAVANHPELNRMNTSLDMGSNDINNARDGRFEGRIATNDMDPLGGYPTTMGGQGIHTQDLYAEGAIGTGQNGKLGVYLNERGYLRASQDISAGVFRPKLIATRNTPCNVNVPNTDLGDNSLTPQEGNFKVQNGDIARDLEGNPLVCTNGQWGTITQDFSKVIFDGDLNPSQGWKNTSNKTVLLVITYMYCCVKKGEPNLDIYLDGRYIGHLHIGATTNWVEGELMSTLPVPSGSVVSFAGGARSLRAVAFE